MPTRQELKQLAKTRLEEAKALIDKGFYDGACYLSGYVVEFALKARICKVLDVDEYPDSGEISKSFKTHKLDHLFTLAGLNKKFEHEKSVNLSLYTNWSLIRQWSEEYRYSPIGTNPRTQAEELIGALEETEGGVFTWIKKRW